MVLGLGGETVAAGDLADLDAAVVGGGGVVGYEGFEEGAEVVAELAGLVLFGFGGAGGCLFGGGFGGVLSLGWRFCGWLSSLLCFASEFQTPIRWLRLVLQRRSRG